MEIKVPLKISAKFMLKIVFFLVCILSNISFSIIVYHEFQWKQGIQRWFNVIFHINESGKENHMTISIDVGRLSHQILHHLLCLKKALSQLGNLINLLKDISPKKDKTIFIMRKFWSYLLLNTKVIRTLMPLLRWDVDTFQYSVAIK